MDIKITNDYENKLLGRREISATTTYSDRTPTKDEIKEELCKRLSLNPELVEVREIKQQYGLRVSDITAYSYASKEVMEKLVKKRGKKGAQPEQKSGAGAPAAAAPAKAEKKEEKHEHAEKAEKAAEKPAEAKGA